MQADIGALARSIFCVGFGGADVGSIPLEALRTFGPGGIILFGRNIGGAGELRAVIAALRACGEIAPLIAVDQEGGRVARITDAAIVAISSGSRVRRCRLRYSASGRMAKIRRRAEWWPTVLPA